MHKNEVIELCSCDKIVAAIVRPEGGGGARDGESDAGDFSHKKRSMLAYSLDLI